MNGAPPLRRVAITGLGLVSSLGPEREVTWSAVLEGRDGLRPLSQSGLGRDNTWG